MLMFRKVWSLAALVAVALLAGIAVYETSVFRDCYASETILQGGIRHQSYAFTKCLWHFIHEHHGPLTATATFLLAIFTTTLWWATRKLVKHAPQIERAYVSGGATIGLEPTGRPGEMRARWLVITVDNYGKTSVKRSYISRRQATASADRP